MKLRKALLVLAILTTALAGPPLSFAGPLFPPADRARELALRLRKLDETRRVLYVTAHPDDEDNGLMALLAHGEGMTVELMTLTRGEGGQNVIGPELQDALAVLRSRELQAMTAWTGHTQSFSCARDFGYSFSVEETFDEWDRESVLKTIVKRIRSFKPDVLLCLPPGGAGGGQHHQASARLAIDAFDLAAGKSWPELGPPHRTRRLFHNIWGPDRPDNRVDVPLGGYDSVLGASYEAVGLAARALHMCQNMAALSPAVPADTSHWAWVASSDPIRDPPRALTSLVEGLPAPSRPPAMVALAERIRSTARIDNPQLIVPDLLEFLGLVSSTDGPADPWRTALRSNAARALELALGIEIEARAERRYVAAGDTLPVAITARNAGNRAVAVTARAMIAGSRAGSTARSPEVSAGLPAGARIDETVLLAVPPDQRPTIDPMLPASGAQLDRVTAEATMDPAWSSFRLKPAITIDGRTIELPDRPIEVQEITDVLPSIYYADPQIVPDPSLRPVLDRIPAPFLAGDSAHVDVTWSVSSLSGGSVDVAIEAPPGCVVTPKTITIETRPGVDKPARFHLALARAGGTEPLHLRGRARAVDTGRTSSGGFREVTYPHIRPGALLEEAAVTVVPFDCRVPDSLRVGFIAGSGDGMPEALAALGITPRNLTDEDLLAGTLSDLDVIITGIRAYKVRKALRAAQPRLMRWVEAGGAMIVQYNRDAFNDGREESPFAPWPGIRGTSRRVTVEDSPVRVNTPDHPLFNVPNRITAEDWEGWVQERGTYLVDARDERYRELLTLSDALPYNNGAQSGALVLAEFGRGHWVYCGLALFRQLPAAVPGGYRLLANLLALGRLSSTHPGSTR